MEFPIPRSEVTQGMWAGVMGESNAWHEECGEGCPVEEVTWVQAVTFANEVSRREGLVPAYTVTGSEVTWNAGANGWRLPTEAEWEYAARGGSESHQGGGGWSRANSDDTVHPACTAGTNGFGLCDTDGNVWEWVWDWHAPYGAESVKDPSGPLLGSKRVVRGGSWDEAPGACTVYVRSARSPTGSDDSIGFRLVRGE